MSVLYIFIKIVVKMSRRLNHISLNCKCTLRAGNLSIKQIFRNRLSIITSQQYVVCQQYCRCGGSCCSVSQMCLTLCDPVDHSMPGLPVTHYLLEFAQVYVYCISDAIQPSHPLTPSSSALNLSQHQGQKHYHYLNLEFELTPIKC